MRIVFMGTPDFAVASLKALLEAKRNIVGVVTATDKPAGRGKKLRPSAVKVFAEENNLKLLQPANLKDEEFVQTLKELNADLQVVVAFRMLPKIVWNMPPKGTINLHGSLLPNYRGAAPINWAIINGDKESGVTTFYIEEKIDTGNIIDYRKAAISDDCNAGQLHDELMEIGAELVVDTVGKIERDEVAAIPQSSISAEEDLQEAPKIFKQTCEIKWTHNQINVYNLIRGMSPYPAAWTTLVDQDDNELMCKIFNTQKTNQNLLKPGNLRVTENELLVGTGTGDLKILELQLAGKKRMSTSQFLLGSKITNSWHTK